MATKQILQLERELSEVKEAKRLVHADCVKSEEEVAALKEEFDKTSQRYR